ncbi:Ras-related protein Rap-1B [Pseudohyphozyma bogoriensis]|nr:Ras-related protein Rap-1B [Pseudohyphozyma bogoriensis]
MPLAARSSPPSRTSSADSDTSLPSELQSPGFSPVPSIEGLEPEEHTREYNIVMMGSGGVGKSAITVRFVHSMFVEKYDPTIEDSYRKMMTVDGMTCSVEILDTAGTEQFMALHSIYMKQGDGFVLVFSLTSLESLSELQQIREQIHRHKEADYGGRQPPRVPLLLVGNKCDLTTERQVPREAAITVSRAWGGVPYYETSARKEINISQLFEDILRQMIKAGAGEQRAGEKKKKARRYPFPLFTAADALAQTDRVEGRR